MIGCCEKNRENYPGKCFEQKKKKLGLKFNPGLALIGLRTTGPRALTCTGLIPLEGGGGGGRGGVV